MNHIDSLIVDLYDRHVLASGTEVTKAAASETLALPIAQELERVERDYLNEAQMRIDHVLNKVRRSRRNHLKANLLTILQALPEDALYVDPLLDMAFPLGDSTGLDKSLRNWTAADFDACVVTAQETANASKSAADELARVVDRVKSRISGAGVEALGDLFPQLPIEAVS